MAGFPNLHLRPAELLQRLIRFKTVNPPGDEEECIRYVAGLLGEYGIESQLFAKVPGRPSLVARVKGEGSAPPLLLYGHVDVVPAPDEELWEHPPFSGENAGGYIWGRGALDMKGGVAMMIAALLKAKAEGLRLPGDVILCVVSDEENGGDFGARFMVEEHPEWFAGVRYAIGEFGASSLYLAGRRFYPIMVAEKQICHLEAIIKGKGGHGSMPVRGQAMAKLGALLQALDRKAFPVRLTAATRGMLQAIAAALPGLKGALLKGFFGSSLAEPILTALGPKAGILHAVLRNTVSATVIRGGESTNVIPSEIVVRLDGRILPGCTSADFLAELRTVLGDDLELKITRHDPGVGEADLGLFEVLRSVLRAADPEGFPIPFLLPGVTDGRHFARLGIQTYGFLPMRLPEDFKFSETIHARNERIPIEALEFGTDAIYQVLQRFGEGTARG